MKARRLIGALVVLGLVGALATAAFAATGGHAKKSAGIKIGVSLAGYSTDFWAAS